MTVVGPRRAPCALLVALLSLAGCTATGAPPSAGASPSPGSASAGEVGPDLTAVGVEIRQDRASWGPRVVQVHVTYDGPGALEVLDASLSTSVIVGPAVSDPAKPKTVPSGSYRDVDVPLGAPVCSPASAETPATDTSVPAEVTLTVATPDGPQDVVANPTDPNSHLERIHAEDCAAQAFDAAATVRFDNYRTTEHGDQLIGLVDLVVDPVVGGPAVSIDQIDQSILFQPEAAATAWIFPDLEPVRAATTVTLEFRPGRCDPHAVADDKRGTFFGLRTTVGGEPQHVFYLQLPESIRAQAKAYIGDACGWGT
ncbi:hypothetical protein OEB99_10090 [Actinotalea sp. M2MS4P-6]|uniref:hypothetical protein n=1 Tax=Actinotalea sp. M2MS4P-6 TaxID=2983762 RepID=UPI0021E3C85A|nr:hypothetical protein [Actinotalea sp. M2MS4P-6]MCV2394657.1 hypothetical protein [Actinotalea sp. M2MS4P-6]